MVVNPFIPVLSRIGIQVASNWLMQTSYCCLKLIPTAFPNVQLPNTLLSSRLWEFLLLR